MNDADFATVSKYSMKNTDVSINPEFNYLWIKSSGFIKSFNSLFVKYLRDLMDEITKQKNLS